MYPWFVGTHDLRPTLKTIADSATQGFVVAAATQTKNAWMPGKLWTNFDLESFVADLRRALPTGHDIDPSAVYVAGHSGAGCNPRGGLATITQGTEGLAVAGIAFIDTCFEVDVARQLELRPPSLRLWILWQTATWQRDPVPFLAQLTNTDARSPRVTELETQTGNPHVGAMFSGIELVVREWLLGAPSENQAADPPSTQPSKPPEPPEPPEQDDS